MSVLYLTEDDVDRLVDMPVAIDVVREAFRRLAAGEAENVPRARSRAGGTVQHSMSAAAGYLGLVGWKNYTTTRAGANFQVGLYDAAAGRMVALIEANRLGQLRTGAVTGLAVDLLALAEVGELGLFGSGWQAESQLAAVCAVRPIRQALVYSRNPDRRTQFADRMSGRLGIEVTPVDRPREAVEDLPLVITATTSREPVFDGGQLAEGSLVCAVGSNWLNRAEIDAATVRRADSIVCDSVECCRREAGDFVDALEKGIFDWSRAVELADVVTDRAVGRPTSDSNVLFKSVGMAIEDVALGGQILAEARKRGAGRVLEL